MGRKYKSFAFFAFLCLVFTGFASGESQGITLFEKNQPVQAIPFLEKDIASGTAEPVEYNYLGISYYQIGNYLKSVEAFKKGLASPGTSKKTLYFNLGNSLYAMGDLDGAIENYSMACVADPQYGKAFLNRGNARLKKDMLNEAADDYEMYLSLEPEAAQKETIEYVLSLIRKEITVRAEKKQQAEEEQKRIQEEEKRIAEAKAEEEKRQAEAKAEEEKRAAEERAQEERRLAEEKADEERRQAEAKAQEAERRRKMLEDVANSLKKDSDNTNMSADAESSLDYDYESDID